MPSDKKGDYEVGYGKPPRNTRFQKGQSGNPSGRAPGNKNLKTLLIDTLNEPVVVTENGGRSSSNSSINRPRATALHETEGGDEPEAAESSFGEADRKVIEQLKARLMVRRENPMIEELTRAQYEAALRNDFALFAARCWKSPSHPFGRMYSRTTGQAPSSGESANFRFLSGGAHLPLVHTARADLRSLGPRSTLSGVLRVRCCHSLEFG